MLDVLPITGTIFALLLTGWLTGRLRLFAPSDFALLGRFVVTLAIPALIFRAITSRPLAGLIDPTYLLAFLLAGLAVFAIGLRTSAALGATPVGRALDAGGMTWPNSGFFGYPILLLALPEVAGHALALNMIVENLVLIPLGLVLAERAQAGRAGVAPILGRLVRNPLLITITVSLAVAATGMRPPDFVLRPVGLLADAAVAMALVVVGGTLAGLGLRAINLRVLATTLGKLVLLPGLVALAWLLLGAAGMPVDPQMRTAGIVIAASPVISIYAVLAAPFGEGGQAALTMLVQIIASFLTLTLLLWSLDLGG